MHSSKKTALFGLLFVLISGNCFALTNEEAIDPLLHAFSIPIQPADTYEEKLGYNLPDGLVERCSQLRVGDQTKVYFRKDRSIRALLKLIEHFHCKVQEQDSPSVQVHLCQKNLVLEKKILGQGKRSVVYALANGNSILKVAKADVGSLLRMTQERDQYPEVLQIAETFKLKVGETTESGGYDESGFFTVKKRLLGETLSAYFFRYKIMTLDENDLSQILIHPDEALSDPNRELIWTELRKFFAASTAHPEIVSDLKSTNFMVTYSDPYKSRVNAIYWADTGKHEIRKSEFYRAPDFSYLSYLENMKRIIQEERDDGVDSISELSFEEIQLNPDYLSVRTLLGNSVRMAEVSKPILNFILSHLYAETFKNGISVLAVLANGSRVATRDRVLELEPDLKEILPLFDDGIIKNSIRNGGITNHSNLSLIVIIDKDTWPETTTALREYSFEVSSRINGVFRLYPLTIRFKTSQPIASDSLLPEDEYYYQQAWEYQRSRKKTLPRSSTVRLDP